jgi:hypothetical protein
MKRLIATLCFAVLATPVLAENDGKPFEQLDLDRALPNIPEPVQAPAAYPFGGSAPYDQLAVDRALPDIAVKGEPARSHVAASGSTRSDVELSTEQESIESPWANDMNFIAPPL